MKIITLVLTLLSFNTYASFEHHPQFRDLTTKNPIINKLKFRRIIKTMKTTFQYLAHDKGEELLIYGDWIDSTADMALARRWDNAQVIIYRGMAHRREINPDALILIICHELGHLYGGEPLKDEYNQISPEGQADYFATNKCLRKALLAHSTSGDIEKRIVDAQLNVSLFLANNWGLVAPQFSTPDTTVVTETLMTHPSPQCRLDTYKAGHKNGPRPSCWYSKQELTFPF
jgi:hypothetical protein